MFNFTVGAWILMFLIPVVVIILIYFDLLKLRLGISVGIITLIIVFGFNYWYFNNTAKGQRAYKTQESNFNRGIERRVSVYDVEGDLIQEYEGKFDIEYDDDRILFDDENGLRHIIYYPTGTVIIDEVTNKGR